MVERSKLLSRRLRVLRSTKTILKRGDPDSFYRAISADGDVQDGINPHCVIADELHRWKVGKALDLWEILERGTIARRQPLVFAITTAGVQDESPLCCAITNTPDKSGTASSQTRTSTGGFTEQHPPMTGPISGRGRKPIRV